MCENQWETRPIQQRIHKILACIDLSDYTLMVLEYAVELARGQSTQVILYNVIHQKDVRMAEMLNTYVPNTVDVGSYVKYREKDCRTTIKGLIKTHFFDDKTKISYKIDVGIPFERILKTIEADDIDLVVMANQGWGNISRVFFGSTAEKVFRHSPVPVVSVRDRKRFKREK